jgi:hypothetical protein
MQGLFVAAIAIFTGFSGLRSSFIFLACRWRCAGLQVMLIPLVFSLFSCSYIPGAGVDHLSINVLAAPPTCDPLVVAGL